MSRMKQVVILVSLSLFGLGLTGMSSCNKNTTEEDPSKEKPKADGPDGKEGSKEKPKEDAKAPPGDVYPGFQFGLLKPENRTKFVTFAKSELCPCEGSGEASLHECLQKEEGRCKVAMQVAEMGAMMYEAGFTETDVSDKAAEFIESTKKVHAFDLENRPFKGDKNAPVTVVEFADFQCGHCKEASKVFSRLVEKHGKTFKVYYKHFPLSGQSFSPIASRAAVAADRQGKFWPMHDLLFKHQKELDPDKLLEFGQRIGLNMQKFKKDLDDPTVTAVVAADRKEGEDAKITGTPSIYINGKLFLGDQTEEEILKAIKEAAATPTEKTN